MTTPDHHIWVFQYSKDWMNCAICGNVKRADGKNKPCKGPTKLREFEKPLSVKWTKEQVDLLNARQKDPNLHPYTCGSGNRTDKNHLDGEGVLVATKNGWKCPYCDYTQNWAHEI